MTDASATVVDPESDVARFLFTGHLKKNRIVRPNAFMPPEDDLRLSVCVRDGLDTPAVYDWGNAHAARRDIERDVTEVPRGFAVLHVKDVVSENLTVERDDVPPRHAEIGNWKPEKEARLETAKQLVALVAELQVKLQP